MINSFEFQRNGFVLGTHIVWGHSIIKTRNVSNEDVCPIRSLFPGCLNFKQTESHTDRSKAQCLLKEKSTISLASFGKLSATCNMVSLTIMLPADHNT